MDRKSSSFLFFRLGLGFLALCALGVSTYLINHFFGVHYPKSLTTASMCDISSFWNCDTATLSSLSNFWGIPTAFFGALFSGLMFSIAILGRPKFDQTGYFLAILNFLGCVFFFAYSLIALNGLCPGCTIYYLLSTLILIIFAKYSPPPRLDFRILGVLGALAALAVGLFVLLNREQDVKMAQISQKFIEEFRESPNYEVYKLNSPYVLAAATPKFEDAPLRITLFSDFQCPVCGVLAEILPKVIRHYEGRVNVQYFTHPLDNACHPGVKETFHPMACEAAYLSVCLKERFREVHDEIYQNQDQLSSMFLQKLANKYGVSECFHSSQSKQTVEEMIAQAEKIGVDSTPTMIVNGRKLRGLLPLKFLIVLMDDAIAQAEEKRKKS